MIPDQKREAESQIKAEGVLRMKGKTASGMPGRKVRNQQELE